MAEIIKMPLLSDTMKEGTVAKWHKKTGDEVKNGDLLAEIETDKATMDFEAPSNGVVLYINGGDGVTIPVGALMVIIGKAGEDISAILASNTTDKAHKTPEPQVEVKQDVSPATIVQSAPPTEQKAIINEPAPVIKTMGVEDDRLKASPLAKAIAKEKGIDISVIKGTGDGGRIIKKDVESYQPIIVQSPEENNPSLVASTSSYEEVAASQMRKTIARRLTESKNGAPHFYLTMPINMDRAIEVRKQLNELSGTKISFNDIIIKASALALKQNPKVNASWLGDKIRYNHQINIGMAVAIEDGLIVPVIRNADAKGMSVIAGEAKILAEKARNRELQPTDWEGNTFTISNLGMFGIEEFTAIINPPDACILAVGGIIEQPIVKNGQIVVGNIMRVTLSCDHRVVDGALGSQFLQTLKNLLEEPMKMLI